MSVKREKSLCRIVEHPLVQHKLTILRDKNTNNDHFRLVMEEVSLLLAYEVSRDLKTREVKIETPMGKTLGRRVSEPVVLVPILRAGMGMLHGMLKLLTFASVGHVGIYRDKFIGATVEYYFRLPEDVAGKKVIVLDPLVATGDTALATITRLKQYEVGPILFVTIVLSELALSKLKKAHPDVEIYALSLESELDSHGLIIPGIGDAGDRLYGTVDTSS